MLSCGLFPLFNTGTWTSHCKTSYSRQSSACCSTCLSKSTNPHTTISTWWDTHLSSVIFHYLPVPVIWRMDTGLPWSGKSEGKTKIFQGQGKVREFCKKVRENLSSCQSPWKVREHCFHVCPCNRDLMWHTSTCDKPVISCCSLNSLKLRWLLLVPTLTFTFCCIWLHHFIIYLWPRIGLSWPIPPGNKRAWGIHQPKEGDSTVSEVRIFWEISI